jgi:hypothetical protein
MKEHGFQIQKITKDVWDKDLNMYSSKRVNCYTGLKWKNATLGTLVTLSSTSYPYRKGVEDRGDNDDKDDRNEECPNFLKKISNDSYIFKRTEEELVK